MGGGNFNFWENNIHLRMENIQIGYWDNQALVHANSIVIMANNNGE
jgi:hypothetical protein